MYGKTGGKNVQLVLQHCWKTSSKAMMCVLPPTLKPSLQQIRFLQVVWILTSDWVKLRGGHAIPRSYVTCCKTGSPAQHVQILLREKIELLSIRDLPQPGLLWDRFDSQAVQRAASLFNSFCSNFAKQVALFYSPFYRSFMQWDLFWPEWKRGASLMQRTAHPVSLLAGDKSVSSFEAYLKTTTLKTWCGAWRSLPADHDSTWRKSSYFNEWITGTSRRSVRTFNLNLAVQSIKLHQCRYLPFIGLIIT